jgi:hypothetical protein
MKSILGFFSLLAFGFLAAGVIAVVATSSGSHLPFTMPAGEGLRLNDGLQLDLPSLLIGLAVGILLSALARISWAELPRRTVSWLLANERNFVRLVWVALFAGILLFY